MPASKLTYPSPPVLCIDASYLLFYRLNALKVWYKHANGDAPTKEAINSSEYQQKLCDRIDATVEELIRRHRPAVVVFAFDGHRNWRKARDHHYKGTRKHDPVTLRLFGVGHKHLKKTYCGGEGDVGEPCDGLVAHHAELGSCVVHSEWPLVCEQTPSGWKPFGSSDGGGCTTPVEGTPIAKKDSAASARKRRSVLAPPNIITMHHDHLEADDIVHLLTRHIASPTQPVVIIASDHDYLPLLDLPQVHVFKLPNTPLQLPGHVKSGTEFLMLKTLMGDKSDNVPPVFQSRPKLNKNTAMALIRAPDQLQQRLQEADPATRQRFEQNQLLVDNRLVPDEYKKWTRLWISSFQQAGGLPCTSAPADKPY
jgi:5'-3' exonuclease